MSSPPTGAATDSAPAPAGAGAGAAGTTAGAGAGAAVAGAAGAGGPVPSAGGPAPDPNVKKTGFLASIGAKNAGKGNIQSSSGNGTNEENKSKMAVIGGDFVLTSIMIIIGVGVLVVLIPCAFISFNDILRLNKFIRKENQRIQNGEKVLIYDSTVYKILKYAEITDKNRGEDFSIYTYLSMARVVFGVASAAVFLLFVNFAIKIALALEDNNLDQDDTKFLKGFALTLYVAMVFVIYLKFVYKRIFEEAVYSEILKRYNSLVDLDTYMYSQMITPPTSGGATDFATPLYNDLLSNNTDAILERFTDITVSGEITDCASTQIVRDIVKQIVTLNIYEYYKKNIPNFDSSEIKTRMFTVAGVQNQSVRPSLYLRIDCTNPIVNLYHSLDLENKIPDSLRECVENELSIKMAEMNQRISKAKLEMQPVVSLFRNYLKTAASYFLILTLIGIIITMKLFDIKYEGSFLQKLLETIKGWTIDRFRRT